MSSLEVGCTHTPKNLKTPYSLGKSYEFLHRQPFQKKKNIYIMAPNEKSLVSGSARGENSLSIVYVYFHVLWCLCSVSAETIFYLALKFSWVENTFNYQSTLDDFSREIFFTTIRKKGKSTSHFFHFCYLISYVFVNIISFMSCCTASFTCRQPLCRYRFKDILILRIIFASIRFHAPQVYVSR